MKDESKNPFILSADSRTDLPHLVEYVNARNASGHAILLGIFESSEKRHIGNIKFEPIDFESKSSWIGILIGDINWRRMGVGSEVITTCMQWMQVEFGIKEFYLGVDSSNFAAINLYKKVGFSEDSDLSDLPQKIVMTYRQALHS